MEFGVRHNPRARFRKHLYACKNWFISHDTLVFEIKTSILKLMSLFSIKPEFQLDLVVKIMVALKHVLRVLQVRQYLLNRSQARSRRARADEVVSNI